ncbi:hypothetical protein FRC12_001992 [Ceratobasidium sp. 428]|nr:hypothetical protein FRC12_001992 [Ceratobasidium sp. 428]
MSEQTQSAATPEQTNGRLSITYNASKDHYCFFCEEGGRIIECSICDLGICYEITDQTTDTTDTGETVGAPDTQCCISVPADMVRNRRRKFRCPQCLSGDKFAQLDYTINRGYRATRRMAIKSAVVIIVYHLKHLRDEAEALTEQLCAYLQVFEIHVVTEVLEIHNEVGEEYALRIRDELLSKSPYHLAVLFFTESDPRGGWWIESAEGEGTGGRATEQKFIKYHTNNLMPLASEAATARIFAVTCGMNMFNDDSIRRIYEALNERPWHSAVFPYAPSILPTRYIEFFPEMFVHLFYFGAPLRSALLRTWAKSFDARQQTGLLGMDRVHWRAGPLDVRKIEHAPFNSRPYHMSYRSPRLCAAVGTRHITTGGSVSRFPTVLVNGLDTIPLPAALSSCTSLSTPPLAL